MLTLQNFSLAPLLRHIFNGGTRKWDAVDREAPLDDETDTLPDWYACGVGLFWFLLSLFVGLF
jgi:hypothetical protein